MYKILVCKNNSSLRLLKLIWRNIYKISVNEFCVVVYHIFVNFIVSVYSKYNNILYDGPSIILQKAKTPIVFNTIAES